MNGSAHGPSLVGLATLNRLDPLLVTWPVENWTLYVSPPPIVRNAQPAEPESGGTTSTGPPLPLIATLIWNFPPLAVICALFTAPLSPLGSLYLKPFTASPLQNGFCVVGLTAGRVNVWVLGFAPSRVIVTVAPLTVGSPTSVLSVAVSFALSITCRLAAAPGSFTMSVTPCTI